METRRAAAPRPWPAPLRHRHTAHCAPPTAGHECVTHHAHYRFPLEVLLSGAGGAAAARAAFLRHTGGGTRTIFSAYGSPYACHIPAASVRAAAAPGGGDEVTVRAVGEAVRDRAAPTMAQAHAAHADAAREMAAAAAVRGSGVRVVKAHWASGACRHCAQPLEPGCLIGAHEPRGWSHVLCLAGGREGAMPSAAPPPPPTLRKRGRRHRRRLRPRRHAGWWAWHGS